MSPRCFSTIANVGAFALSSTDSACSAVDGDRPSVDDVPGIDLLVEGGHRGRGLSQAFSAIVHITGEHPGLAGSSAL